MSVVRLLLLLLCGCWSATTDRVQAFVVNVGSHSVRPNVHSSRPENVTYRSPLFRATLPSEGQAAEKVKDDDSTKGPDMKAYASGYKTVFAELPFRKCSPSVGEIPKDLLGSYFRSGPAMFSAGSIVPPKTSIVQPRQPPVPDGEDHDRMVPHPFEGDGAVLGVTFSGDGEVSARFRYVRTVAFTNERKKGARIYKAMDSTRAMAPSAAAGVGNDLPLPLFRHHLQPGLNKNRKNTSNTRAIYWGKRLLTMWEGGQPYKLDARALDTEGRSRLGGVIQRDADSFGAKMSYDAKSNRALFYGVELGAVSTDVTMYEFDADFRLVEGGRTTTDLPGCALINDFASTENYAVFAQPNVVANKMQFVVGKEPGKTLNVEDGPAKIHLIPRVNSKRKPVSLEIPMIGPREANLQFCNAYEDGDEVVIDAILSDGSAASGSSPLSWPWGSSLDEYQRAASKKSLWRYSIDSKSGKVTKKLLLDNHCFFGTVNPAVSSQKHRYIYMNTGALGAEVAPPQGIARVDCQTGETTSWQPKRCEFCGEPMYAPRKGKDGEDSGYILSVLYCGVKQESELIILEASNIAAGPITRIPLGIAIPHGLFGCFTMDEAATWDPESLERRAKLADKIESRGNMWNEVKSDFSGLGLRLDDMEEYFGDFFS